jgi:mRNA interferase HigB
MRVITKARLKEFWETHPQARTPLEDWYRITEKALWESIEDVRQIYPAADSVKVKSGGVVTIFNIGGNKYRLVAAVHYNTKRVYVLQIMTHEEYSRDAWKDRL